MSEEILKALMQLFAIIVKQDAGVETNEIEYVRKFLKQQLDETAVLEYMAFFNSKAGVEQKRRERAKGPKLTSVKDSVRILGICRKINKKLNHKQKVVVLVRLFELVNTDRKFSDQRMAIINTVAEVFNIAKEEFNSIQTYVIETDLDSLNDPAILLISHQENICQQCKHIQTEELHGELLILQIASSDLYFLRYTGKQDVFLNGLAISNKAIYLFAPGSTVKLPKGKPIYYSDVVSRFLADSSTMKLSFCTDNITFRFRSGTIGIRNVSFSESQGKLLGIMGASGAGKTTLLNVLSGIDTPTEGEIRINGINLHKDHEKLEGVIGYIPQDDLLIEELTVFENLYYAAKLCFNNKKNDEISELVNKLLISLGLHERKHLMVGSPLNKTISGGQRKRLNIALELIREPSILFVDEPTSGLSSRDSENVMDLLRELTLKGKMIFVVIHQPSSDIYKMFDKMIILDTGGYLIYYGNPVEGIVHFKKMDNQINSEVGECPTCGNVTPELIFNIVEAQVVDEFGNYTNKRKVSPPQWEKYYRENVSNEVLEDVKEKPPVSSRIPTWIKQLKIYSMRDFFTKISNTQYIVLNLLEAPLLGFILSYIIRYIADPNSDIYIFRDNENIPPYIFMSIVVALFLGMTVSAEEIFRDRKILKREAFLNLSRSSYLVSKIFILIVISAIQAFLFVIVGNSILAIKGMLFIYWFALFSTFVFANMLGLNISATFNSAVTIYILIPILMIPQMALGGAMFSFDKLNRNVGSIGKVPIVAELMAARWAYEALMVYQFKNNEFEKNRYYDIEKRESVADFKQVYYLPEIQELMENAEADFEDKSDSVQNIIMNDLELVRYELGKEMKRVPSIPFDDIDRITLDSINDDVFENTYEYINKLEIFYARMFTDANSEKDRIISYLDEKHPTYYRNERNKYHNEALSDHVRKTFERNKILRYKNSLIQQYDLIYLDPDVEGFFNFRTHFYSPVKHFMGKYFDTYTFNMFIIWLVTLVLYITLYFDMLKRVLNAFEKLKLPSYIANIKLKKTKKEDIKTKKKKRQTVQKKIKPKKND